MRRLEDGVEMRKLEDNVERLLHHAMSERETLVQVQAEDVGIVVSAFRAVDWTECNLGYLRRRTILTASALTPWAWQLTAMRPNRRAAINDVLLMLTTSRASLDVARRR